MPKEWSFTFGVYVSHGECLSQAVLLPFVIEPGCAVKGTVMGIQLLVKE